MNSLSRDPAIRYALKVTNTTIEDLKTNWFGRGRGFEHVFAGEVSKRGKVGGFHWWYRYYVEEQAGRLRYDNSIANAPSAADMVTVRFHWDPDGPGPIREGRKSRGSFIVGCSPQVMLAIGHITVETARARTGSVPGWFYVETPPYKWQIGTDGGTIRTLYPMALSRK